MKAVNRAFKAINSSIPKDNSKEIKKNDIHSLHPSYKLFKSVKKQLDEKKAIFSSEFEKWRQAKEGITFQKAL